ncbi:GntR family transcriptional regulator [Bacillus toyonensis]|uniref:GntR family transcriptional regulator n=1 Tax=Bacillus toyonensis TaxID=155322 RepID=UPI0015856B30|nr:GntR family transcriptional regulator [Bacillus toyonensis]
MMTGGNLKKSIVMMIGGSLKKSIIVMMIGVLNEISVVVNVSLFVVIVKENIGKILMST